MSAQVADLLKKGTEFLKTRAIEDAAQSSELLLSFSLQKPRSALLADFGSTVSQKAEALFFDLLQKRSTHYPVQYLTGRVPFDDLYFEVEQGVFIPRPETEHLVESILTELAGKKVPSLQILEVGTGSGCVAVSLARRLPNASLVATDISEKAVQVAMKNARINRVASQIQFIRTGYWNGISGSFDCLVSNPPYLSAEDLKALQPEITYEPREALDGGQDGLDAYRSMIKQAKEVLHPGGLIAFELGIGQAPAVNTWLTENYFSHIHITKDLAGIDRVVTAIRS
ncbi:MAG: protein-(glutamine-N5) methyltransferase, release factor-specific [Candidatus Omnitrophica bacterium CG11_big_fil_rev_8_21_14_0_20_45_26]|uniref:Release factor glutamine methyltransferase n=1 Tax=Candidatus Abzuiibacterium crystallinum TaxID=1974748 RepID=A0A2H0LM71_9BACT|nr:MAG: protein-(glutamine-N5) methyltransferase, release factor-specific [Candidatus Omnitrophica bacterium CG11_big_fil_rev_8_21_14_0_20_45_26]PIW63712.1 MAG: peptide chain release factor N(5)-glutamine methyltransferase [Candidatus Omnitrophica bacterium CG12_big_fil_rev_8_21_14_0_65_45_16]